MKYNNLLIITQCYLFLILLINAMTKLEAAPVLVPAGLQFLPPREGYVPVYIRNGDTPLEEINPDLAEAFHVYELKQKHLKEQQNKIQDDTKTIDQHARQLKLLDKDFKFGTDDQTIQ